MNIAVYLADQNPHRDRSLGISRMSAVLLNGLLGLGGFEFETICSRSSFKVHDDRVRKRILPWRTDRLPGRVLADNLHPLFAGSDADLWFYPKGFLPYVRKPDKACVGIVHDTILLWSYDYYRHERSRLNYAYWIGNLKRSLARFDLVLTVSQSARAQIEAACERFSIRAPALEVVYESPGIEGAPLGLEKSDYVVHIASRAPHKRSEWLIREWALALKRGMELPRLVLIGSLPQLEDISLLSTTGIELLPYLGDDDFFRVIAAARALILPSEIEGFGLPALEAYLLGTAVCYVEGTAVDEVLGMPSGLGAFRLSDPESLFVALEDVMGIDESLMRETADRLRGKYDPKRFAARVAEKFHSMI
jgi:glycosyltransferase involved in cell wall biosynthesis